MTEPIRVLVVDDSRAVRAAFGRVLSGSPDIELVGAANDPYEAVAIMRGVTPDVIILDIQMPRMDGLTFLRKLMDQHPIPVIVCSAHVGPDSGQAILALERGAVDIIAKPRVGAGEYLESSRELVVAAVRAAAATRLDRRPGWSPDMAPKQPAAPRGARRAASKVVVIGASTGGVEAIRAILPSLGADTAGIAIAQHMPAGFTAAFAERLNGLGPFVAAEARGGEVLAPGTVFVAPGDAHLVVRPSERGPFLVLSDEAPVNRHRPSVDVLFRSAASGFGADAMGILLTGMGADGAAGMQEMHHFGATTIAQDEATSVVFGMPSAAIARGAAGEVLPLAEIGPRIAEWSRA